MKGILIMVIPTLVSCTANKNRYVCYSEYEAAVDGIYHTVTGEVRINNMIIKNGKPLVVSNNPFMYRDVEITGFDNLIR